MIQYCARFIPNLATISAPLRLLTHNDVQWEWTDKQQFAFDELKKLLTTNTVMGYFDPLKQTELHVDASPVGLGAILSQITPGNNDRTILAYASRLQGAFAYKITNLLLNIGQVQKIHLTICQDTHCLQTVLIHL